MHETDTSISPTSPPFPSLSQSLSHSFSYTHTLSQIHTTSLLWQNKHFGIAELWKSRTVPSHCPFDQNNRTSFMNANEKRSQGGLLRTSCFQVNAFTHTHTHSSSYNWCLDGQITSIGSSTVRQGRKRENKAARCCRVTFQSEEEATVHSRNNIPVKPPETLVQMTAFNSGSDSEPCLRSAFSLEVFHISPSRRLHGPDRWKNDDQRHEMTMCCVYLVT